MTSAARTVVDVVVVTVVVEEVDVDVAMVVEVRVTVCGVSAIRKAWRTGVGIARHEHALDTSALGRRRSADGVGGARRARSVVSVAVVVAVNVVDTSVSVLVIVTTVGWTVMDVVVAVAVRVWILRNCEQNEVACGSARAALTTLSTIAHSRAAKPKGARFSDADVGIGAGRPSATAESPSNARCNSIPGDAVGIRARKETREDLAGRSVVDTRHNASEVASRIGDCSIDCHDRQGQRTVAGRARAEHRRAAPTGQAANRSGRRSGTLAAGHVSAAQHRAPTHCQWSS